MHHTNVEMSFDGKSRNREPLDCYDHNKQGWCGPGQDSPPATDSLRLFQLGVQTGVSYSFGEWGGGAMHPSITVTA